MAETQAQRVLHLARAGCSPADIAQFLGIGVTTVLTDLADLTVDGATQKQRILTFLLAGHHPDEIAEWLGVSVTVVAAAAADLSQPMASAVVTLGGAVITVPPYSL